MSLRKGLERPNADRCAIGVNAMEKAILVSCWIMFCALAILTIFSSYRSAAAIYSLSPPPLPFLVFAGAIFNAVATGLVVCWRNDSIGRSAKALVLGLTFAFWIAACGIVIFFVLSLTGSFSRPA